MSSDNQQLEFVRRRLNSFMNTIMEGREGVGNTQTHSIEHYGLKQFREFHRKVLEMFPDNEFLPVPLTDEELKKEYQYGRGFYFKTTIREIADALGITLDFDRKNEQSPLMAQYQTQSSTQINLQSMNNVIECINSLQIEWDKKEELVKLAKEFEKSLENKDSGKLKDILKKVANISPRVAGFLLEHAGELGHVGLLLGI